MEQAMTAIRGGWPWWGHHMAWGGGIMMIGWTLLLVILVVGAWAFVRDGWSPRRGRDGPRDRAEEVLREEFARGQIDEETYRGRLNELRRH